MYLPLDLVKKHLNIEEDFTQDDEYLMMLIDGVEQAVEVHVNEKLESIAQKHEGCIPAPLFNAMLLELGNLYQNRETNILKGTPNNFSYQYLIDLYRNYNN